MYIADKLKMTEPGQMQDFIDQFGFATLVSPSLNATHLPLLLHRDEGKRGVLYGHFARANPHWKELDGQSVLAIFNGPHGYISPSWYAKAPAVPTWNYTTVHAYGTVSLVDPAESADLVDAAIRKYEPELLADRQIVTETVRDKLLSGVVGIAITLTHIEGKLKLGQERSREDQQGVFARLNQSDRPEDQALASYMAGQKLGTG